MIIDAAFIQQMDQKIISILLGLIFIKDPNEPLTILLFL